MTKNFPKLMKDNKSWFQEAQRISSRITASSQNKQTKQKSLDTSRVKLLKSKDKEEILKVVRKKKHYMQRNNKKNHRRLLRDYIEPKTSDLHLLNL